MKKVFFISFLFSVCFVFSQGLDPSLKGLKYKKNSVDLQQVFISPYLAKKEISFRLNNSSSQKPIFCRMEDNISNHYNVMFQLRAGSDQDYRKMAFPKKVEKKDKYIE